MSESASVTSDSLNSDTNLQPPALRNMDQTPIEKQDPKRKHCELSPTEEEGELVNLIKATVKEAIAESIPTIVDQVKTEVMSSMKTLLKKEMEELLKKEMEDLKTSII